MDISHRHLLVAVLQFLAWDTHARRRIDLVGRKDDGDKVIAHEFDYSIKNQVSNILLNGVSKIGTIPLKGSLLCRQSGSSSAGPQASVAAGVSILPRDGSRQPRHRRPDRPPAGP